MNAMELAQRFATALDEEDYAVVVGCLAADCVYRISGEIHRGPEAIIASYRSHGEWAAKHLDRVRYESHVRDEGGDVAIEFVDHIEQGGRAHTYRCEQRLSFDDGGQISVIEHVDLPGEGEALNDFFRAVGLAPSPPA